MGWYVKEDSVTPEEATNQLFRAARSGNAEEAQAALAAGADVNARDDWQRTPLHCAIGARHGELARVLIERGTDLRAQDHQQQTALHWAARNGLSNLARLLLERGANPAAQDKWRYTPFDWASLSGHTELATFLLDAARGRTGHTDRILRQRDHDHDPSRG
jgi:ankyrin repeat protein